MINKNSDIETRCLTAELRAEPTESRTITGYAARFDSWSEPIMGWFKERIDSRAFEECDTEDVIMCFNHNADSILARTTSKTLKIATDERGLHFEFEAPNTSMGNDMLELVRRGDISKCSFKFSVEQDEWRYADKENKLKYDERTIYRISKLYDVSLVVYPAYTDTEASARKLEERKAEWLKDKEPKGPTPIDTTSRTRTTQFLKLKDKS